MEKLAVSIKNGEKKLCVTMYNPLPLYPEILAYESNAYCIISDEGEGTIWAFGRDISQRIKHEQQIKRFSQILDKTIEYLPAGIVVKDIKTILSTYTATVNHITVKSLCRKLWEKTISTSILWK